jgi:NAD-dependent SIR2 family protein deacetylase
MLQDYFDRKGLYPPQYAPNEYSFYFEKCYSYPLARKRFIESIVAGREPSIGYLCLAEANYHGKIKNIWTTNFDTLLENAIHRLYPVSNIIVCSEANRNSVHILNPEYPVVGKLHGDYRY